MPDGLYDPQDFVSRIVGERFWASYSLLPRNEHSVWRIEYWYRTGTFDAGDGQTSGCAACDT